MRKITVALSLAIQLAIAGTALAQSKPVDLSKSQLMMQDEETRVLNLLSAAGYTGIGDLQHTGKTWTTTATKDGKSAQVVIDPAAGTVNGM
jgi:hypothetical protein